MGYRERNNYSEQCPEDQRHVHEIQGSVKTADQDHPHEHRFCTVTGEAILYNGNNHVHEVAFRTDTHGDHYHEFRGKTSCAYPIGDRHVHYLESVTSVDDGHRHMFEAATLIENPTGEKHKKEEHCKDRYRGEEYYKR